MAWDSSRPVDWKRLFREWLLYVVIMVGIFLLVFRDRPLAGIVGGAVMSLPLYLFFGYVLAKFGVQRARRPRQSTGTATSGASTSSSSAASSQTGNRPKPAPTKRTGGGGRPASATKRRR